MATAILTDNLNNKVLDIYPIDYSYTSIEDKPRQVSINSILPFRVKFIPIQIESIRDAIPAIPLQVIGYSNYIL
jgi:hypothetical protein